MRLHCYTYLEYRSLEDASVTKHEFLDGEIYAMAGGNPLHAALGAAVVTSLGSQLGGSPCRVYNSNLRVRVVATGLATYPDASVVCGDVESDLEDRQAVVNPKAIVEVLSDGTEAYDRGEKLAHYQKIASLDAVVLVSQKERRIELWQRQNAGWLRAEAGRGESLVVNSIGCTLTVDAVYDAAGAEQLDLVRADEDPSRFLEDVVLGELIRRGLLTPPRLQDKRPPPRLPVTSLKRLLDELAKDRGER